MKIALINENSQAAKNALIEETLKKVVEPLGHEVHNYGMYSAEDKEQLTYVQIGILSAVLLNSGACDLVITGCGTGEGAMLVGEEAPKVCTIPFYDDLPLSAGHRDSFDPTREKPSAYISIPTSQADFYFPVSGNSMEPEFNDGDIVGVKRVDRSEGIVHGAVYMVVTNENRMIKHCYIDENNPELLWCVSPNYPSFPINRADICAMFRVVSRIQYF